MKTKLKSIVLFAAFIFIGKMVAFGQSLKFDTKEIDYGTIEQGADPLRKFKFTNTSKDTVIISNAQGSCGCTVPTWPKEPIMPGKEGVIEVRYDTQRVGAFTKTVTLTTNDKTTPNTVLTIKGTVTAKPADSNAPATAPTNGGH